MRTNYLCHLANIIDIISGSMGLLGWGEGSQLPIELGNAKKVW